MMAFWWTIYSFDEQRATKRNIGRITKIYQPNALEVVLQIRAGGRNVKLLFSIHPSYSRVHLTEQTIENPADPPMFCSVAT